MVDVPFIPCAGCGAGTRALARTKTVPVHGRVGVRECLRCEGRAWYLLASAGGAFVGPMGAVCKPVPPPLDNSLRQLTRAPCRFPDCTHLKALGPYCNGHQQQYRRRGRDHARLTPLDPRRVAAQAARAKFPEAA